MSILTKIFSGGAADLVKGVGGVGRKNQDCREGAQSR